MVNRLAFGAVAVMALAAAGVGADDGIKSGVPVGKTVSTFHPLNLTGPAAGQKRCLV